jgi:ankyrin repeat protein
MMRRANPEGGDNPNDVALHAAVERDNIDGMRAALDAGANPSWLIPGDSRKRSLAHLAARKGNLPALALLAKRGARLDSADYFGELPVDIAIQFFEGAGKEHFCLRVAELTGSGVAKSPYALAFAAERGFVRLVDALAALGCSVHSEGSLGHVGLAAPVFAGSLSGAKRLLELGAVLERLDDNGQTPLHLAAARGHKEVARWLLSVGADVNAVQLSGATSLHRAMNRDDVEMVSALLDAGADPMIKNAYGKTAFEHAVECNCVQIMSLLETRGFAPSMDQERIDNYLVCATKAGHAAMVGHLLGRGADPAIRSNGRSLLQHARGDAVEVKHLILAARAGDVVVGAVAGPAHEGDMVTRIHSPAL